MPAPCRSWRRSRPAAIAATRTCNAAGRGCRDGPGGGRETGVRRGRGWGGHPVPGVGVLGGVGLHHADDVQAHQPHAQDALLPRRRGVPPGGRPRCHTAAPLRAGPGPAPAGPAPPPPAPRHATPLPAPPIRARRRAAPPRGAGPREGAGPCGPRPPPRRGPGRARRHVLPAHSPPRHVLNRPPGQRRAPGGGGTHTHPGGDPGRPGGAGGVREGGTDGGSPGAGVGGGGA